MLITRTRSACLLGLVGVLEGCVNEPAVPAWTSSAARGMNIVCWWRGCFDGPAAERTFARAQDLHVSHVALVLTWYVPDGKGGAPSEHPQKSPTLEEYERAAKGLKGIGLRVLLKPHVDRLDGGSRTEIDPEERESWWQAYRDLVLAVAELADRVNAEAMAIGTELTRLSSDSDRWKVLVADVRARYRGELTYAANWDEVEGIAFLDELDWVGVDGYYPQCTTDAPTVLDHVAAWQVHLARLHRVDAIRRNGLVFTEIGAPSRDPQSQARVYSAALRALGDEGGVFFWNLWDGDRGGTHVATESALAEVSAAWR